MTGARESRNRRCISSRKVTMPVPVVGVVEPMPNGEEPATMWRLLANDRVADAWTG